MSWFSNLIYELVESMLYYEETLFHVNTDQAFHRISAVTSYLGDLEQVTELLLNLSFLMCC